MERENQIEWIRFQDTALEILRKIKHERGRRLLQLLVIPSFEIVNSYNIFRIISHNQPTSYLVKTVNWRYDLDLEKFRTPLERLKYPATLVPTLESKSSPITAETVEQILDQFRHISLPMWTDNKALGLDGTSYEIQLGDGFLLSRFHWWHEQPTEWQQLHLAFHQTIMQLKELDV